MAYRSYMLIRLRDSQPSKQRVACASVMQVSGVEFVDAVTGGPCDLIAIVESAAPDATAGAMAEIEGIAGVTVCRVTDVSADPGMPVRTDGGAP